MTRSFHPTIIEICERYGIQLSGDTATYQARTFSLNPITSQPESRADAVAVGYGLVTAITQSDTRPKNNQGQALKIGSAALRAKVERFEFIETFQAIRSEPHEQLVYHDFGQDLCLVYYLDGFARGYLTRGHFDLWHTDRSTVLSIARSNIYALAEFDYRATVLNVGDGYDAARLAIVDDLFYDRDKGTGIEVAIISRDELLVGPNLNRDDVLERFNQARYPLSDQIYSLKRHKLSL